MLAAEPPFVVKVPFPAFEKLKNFRVPPEPLFTLPPFTCTFAWPAVDWSRKEMPPPRSESVV